MWPSIAPQRALSILAVADLVAWRRSLGHDTAPLLAGTGITEAELSDPEALITPRQEQLFFGHWVAQAGRADCGLAVGQRYRLMHFGHLGLLMPHAATRREAVALFLRFINLSYTHFIPEADLDTGRLRLRGGEHLGPLRRFYLDRDVAFTVGLLRAFFKDGEAPPLQVQFDENVPAADLAHYEAVLGIPVRFGAPVTQVSMDPSRLDEPMPDANALMVRLLQPQCEARAAQVLDAQPVSWAHRVREVFRQHGVQGEHGAQWAPGSWPDASEVSRRLRCSERTLRRRLADEGQALQALSDAERSGRAAQWLRREGARLDDIATALGYSEAAAFIRAYKRWFGRPPGVDRR